MKLYTCLGDDGYTYLANGKRILKSDDLVELIGTLDEFSSLLGVAKVHTDNKELFRDVEKVQKMTFTVMAELAGGKELLTEKIIKNVEEMTDRYCNDFSGFTLSGETKASTFLDVARCIVRRAERRAIKVFRKKRMTRFAMCWLNRISDLVYAMARYAAKE